METRVYRRTVPILLVVVWVVIIFMFSLQEGDISQQNSRIVVNLIYKYFFKFVEDVDEGIIHYYVRKGAHIVLYLILCLSVMNALCCRGFRGRRLNIRAFVICLFYASMDEVVQGLVRGRSGKATDVIIDSIGILMGLMIGGIISKGNRKG